MWPGRRQPKLHGHCDDFAVNTAGPSGQHARRHLGRPSAIRPPAPNPQATPRHTSIGPAGRRFHQPRRGPDSHPTTQGPHGRRARQRFPARAPEDHLIERLGAQRSWQQRSGGLALQGREVQGVAGRHPRPPFVASQPLDTGLAQAAGPVEKDDGWVWLTQGVPRLFMDACQRRFRCWFGPFPLQS